MMEASNFNETWRHKGHNLVVRHYVEDVEGKSPEQVCVECHDCDAVLLSVRKGEEGTTHESDDTAIRALKCVVVLCDILWPRLNDPESEEWDSSTTTEIANCLGNLGFGPHAQKQEDACVHEVDPYSLSPRRGEDVVDCNCRKCGCSGSFCFECGTAEVMWAED
jgi:hypothetical protein